VLSILKQHWLTVICLASLLLVAALQVNNLMILSVAKFTGMYFEHCKLATACFDI
jgi:hypothetical protein